MLRHSCRRIVLTAALTPLAAVVVPGQLLPAPAQIEPQTAREPLSNAPLSNATVPAIVPVSVPVCYIQLENSQLRDLRGLCGKKSLSPAPARNVPRSVASPNPNLDDDDSTSTATPRFRTPSQPPPASSPQPLTRPTPPIANPLPNTPGRPPNSQPSLATPATTAPSPPNPLAIPEDRD